MAKIFSDENNPAYESENSNLLRSTFEAQGWNYVQNGTQFKLSFLAAPECKIANKLHSITVFPDKLYTATALGIKTSGNTLLELFKLMNYLNSEQLFYGRFVISKGGTLWYDYSIDLMHCEICEEICIKAVTLPDNSIERFCNNLFDVNAGLKTAEDVIISYEPKQEIIQEDIEED